MFERFTDRARKVMALANEEVRCRGHEFMGTEHILLGLLREGGGTGAAVLANLGVDAEGLLRELDCVVTSSRGKVAAGEPAVSGQARRVVEHAIAEARLLKHSYIGTEHLLLGLMRESAGTAALVMTNLGLSAEAIRDEVTVVLKERGGSSD